MHTNNEQHVHTDEKILLSPRQSAYICKGTHAKQHYQRKFPLKRGQTGVDRHDLNGQGRLAGHAVPGWENINTENLKIQDVSGAGGGKTFIITAPSCIPEKVVLHAKVVGLNKHEKEQRIEDATYILSKENLTPKRISEGGDWYIEPYVGESTLTKDPGAEKMGQLLAKIHKTPTDWFEPYKNKAILKYPFLNDVSQGSHFWVHVCNDMEKEQYTWVQKNIRTIDDLKNYDDIEPLSEVCRRVVTSHGDFHRGNVLRLPDGGLIACDLENMHVGYAIHDIGYHFCLSAWQDGKTLKFYKGEEYQRKFLKAYLEESGLNSCPGEIEKIMYDAAFTTINYFWFSLFEDDKNRKRQYKKQNIEYPMDHYKAMREIYEQGKTSIIFIRRVIHTGAYFQLPELKLAQQDRIKKYGQFVWNFNWKNCFLPNCVN